MKTNQKTSKKLLLATSALSLGLLAGGFALLGGEKAAAEAAIPEGCTFEILDGTSLKLNEGGGLRFIVKMNDAAKEYIADNDTENGVKLVAHVAPVSLIATKSLKCEVAEEKLYQLSDKDGWYANVCLVDVLPQNRAIEYTAQAFLKIGGQEVQASVINEQARGSFYDVATRALLDTEENYTQQILGLSNYKWLGSEEYPLMIDSLELYNNLVAKVNADYDFSERYIVIDETSVDVNQGNKVDDGKSLPEALNVVTYMDGDKLLGTEYVKSGAAAKFKPADDPNAEGGTRKFVKWVEKGGETEADLSSISGNLTVYGVFRTVLSNKIELNASAIAYGEEPNVTATATHGEAVFTYATEENGKYKAWKDLENHNVGTYYVKASVAATDEYDGAEATASFEVKKATNNKIANFTMASIIHCNDTPEPSATPTHGNVEYQYSKLADKDFVDSFEKAKYPGIGNFTYYVKAVVKETDNYTGAESEVKAFRFEHKFENGICSLGGTAHEQDGIKYEINGDVACIASYDGNHSTEVYPLAEYTKDGKTYKVTSVKKECAWNSITTKIVLPESVTDFGGNSFVAAENLEYISMTGVKHISTDNNFLNCTKIKTVIVNKDLQLDNQQFKKHNTSESAQGIIYVDGAIGESTFRFTAPASNEYLTETIYYKGDDASKCGQWNYSENGEVAYGAAHNYENGICKECGKYSEEKTSWVIYGYKAPASNNSNGVYYVGMNKNLDLKNVKILEQYNDGIHGELPVTYVQENAFQDNPYIEKVILPDSVKSLNGSVFAGCSKLTFVSMTGVEDLRYHGSSLGYVDGRGNNFINCTALKYVVLSPNFSTDAQQFFAGTAPTQPILDIYVNAASGTPNFGGANTNLLTGTIYYKGDATKCLQWNYDENGNIQHGLAAHNYENGICTACDDVQSKTVQYAYDSANDTYYVSGVTEKTEKEIYVRAQYNDGTHGVKNVTYVAKGAFASHTVVTKIVLPESVTDLGGGVFTGCTQLKYVDARGIKRIEYGKSGRPDGAKESNNNFRNCDQLTTVIIGDGYSSNVGQFNSEKSMSADIYVYGTNAFVKNASDTGLSGKIYYYSETLKSGCWHFDDNGNVAIWE